MRKSINLGGGFRINLSKSGIGYSWGVPGYRITKTARGTTRKTYFIPGTGISYVDEGKKRSGYSAPPKSDNLENPYYPQINSSDVRNIDSADISEFKSADVGNITMSIERTLRLNRVSNILLWITLLAFAQPVFFLCTVAGVVLKIVTRRAGAIQLEYSFDDEAMDEYENRIGAWMLLTTSRNLWQILQEARVHDRKYNAGAGINVKRVPCKIIRKTPFYINSNVDVVQIILQKETLLILPDKVFIIRKNKVGIENYADIFIQTGQTRFIENGVVPKDARVVDHTWQYVNKSGGPDRRFKNNRQLPICLYGCLSVRSTNGLNIEMHCSCLQNVLDFAEIR